MNGQIIMDGFSGEYSHALDPKKRLTIPSAWRELVGAPDKLFVMPGVGVQALYIFPAREMSRRIESIRNLSVSDIEGRKFARIVASRSDYVGWDSQGRIRIKDELLAYAGITSQAILVGAFEGFELWNPERWTVESGQVDDAMLTQAAKAIGF